MTPNPDRVSIIDSNEYARRVVGGILIDKAGQYPIDGSLSNVNVDLVQALAWLGIQIASMAAFILDQAVEPSPDTFFHLYIDIDPLNQTHYTIRLQVPNLSVEFLRHAPTPAAPNTITPTSTVIGGPSTIPALHAYNSGPFISHSIVLEAPGSDHLRAMLNLGVGDQPLAGIDRNGDLTLSPQDHGNAASAANRGALRLLRNAGVADRPVVSIQLADGGYVYSDLKGRDGAPGADAPTLTFQAHTVIGTPGDVPALGVAMVGREITYTLNIPPIPELPDPDTFLARTVIGAPGDVPALGVAMVGREITYTLNIPPIPVVSAVDYCDEVTIPAPGTLKSYKWLVHALISPWAIVPTGTRITFDSACGLWDTFDAVVQGAHLTIDYQGDAT
ncbi:MAG: hypothetical protein H0X30_37110, partial [Anaerolineae bacterium]|nr:hypothetical protein [Anaerolineae bacterium]